MKKEKNNKYGLLKVIGISFLIFTILTWVIPSGIYGGSGYTNNGTNPVGLYGMFINPAYSFAIFAQYFVLLLVIGGFYGVLNKTGVYSKIINSISKKFENKKNLVLVSTILLFSIFSSLVGSQIALFIFVPFAIAILMSIGFGKITSLAATAGSILVGFMGSTYGTSVVFKSFFSLDANNGIIYKAIFFVLVIALYIFFILGKEKLSKKNTEELVEKTKQSKKKKDKSIKEEVISDLKLEIPLYDNKISEKRSSLPLIIILILTVLIIFVGMFNWYYTFNLEFFNNIYESIMTVELGGTAIFAKIFGQLPQVGSFSNYDLTAILFIAAAVIAWVYGIKFNDFIDSIVNGSKKMILPAIYVMFACTIFAVIVNSESNIASTIVNFLLGLVKEFNVLAVSLVGLICSFFFNDFPYLLNGIYGSLIEYDTTVYPVISILLNATYGLSMMILPVSIILIAGLKYMDISYKEWFKFIWKFLLQAFILIILFALIVLAIIQ